MNLSTISVLSSSKLKVCCNEFSLKPFAFESWTLIHYILVLNRSKNFLLGGNKRYLYDKFLPNSLRNCKWNLCLRCLLGLQGYARLKSGDSYEVVIKYGERKWRIRGSVKSSSKQVWENPNIVLKARIHEILLIKVISGMHCCGSLNKGIDIFHTHRNSWFVLPVLQWGLISTPP